MIYLLDFYIIKDENIDMKIVIGLGGNALISKDRSFEGQYSSINDISYKLALLIKKGYRLVITHGNGPQVGETLLRHEHTKDLIPPLPLFACVAETQGLLGFMLESSINKHLSLLNTKSQIVTLLSRVMISIDDPYLSNPTKPIGPFYYEENIKDLLKINPNIRFKKIDGMYRRVVPSPEPIKILNIDAVKRLLDDGFNVITGGGGGIPIANDHFIDAVIDKDLTSERLATELNVSKLILLTNEKGVYLNYKSENERLLKNVTTSELKYYLACNKFEEGSMKPKVKAALRFVENTKREAVIADLDDLLDAVDGKAGTVISL
ncbi:MAG: carbamate kinase [Candidatus Nitrosocaldaceae archaeon]